MKTAPQLGQELGPPGSKQPAWSQAYLARVSVQSLGTSWVLHSHLMEAEQAGGQHLAESFHQPETGRSVPSPLSIVRIPSRPLVKPGGKGGEGRWAPSCLG